MPGVPAQCLFAEAARVAILDPGLSTAQVGVGGEGRNPLAAKSADRETEAWETSMASDTGMAPRERLSGNDAAVLLIDHEASCPWSRITSPTISATSCSPWPNSRSGDGASPSSRPRMGDFPVQSNGASVMTCDQHADLILHAGTLTKTK